MQRYEINYWSEALYSAMEDAGIKDFAPTKEQMEKIVKSLQISRDCESMAFGHDCIPNPLSTEIRELKGVLEKERRIKDNEIVDLHKLNKDLHYKIWVLQCDLERAKNK